MFLVISEILIISICGLYLYVILRDHVKRKKLYSKGSIILQYDIQKRMDEFGFQENEILLNNKKNFAIPYSAIGYTED